MLRPLLILIGIGLALLVTLVVLVATFDANRYKPELIELGRRLTGRDFDIRGDISLKTSLTPTLVVDGISLGNADWAEHANMLDLAHFEAQVSLIALLRHRIEVIRVVIHGANLVLERDYDDDGRGNWAFETSSESPTAPRNNSFQLFDIEHISLRDSRIEYRSEQGDAVVVEAERIELSPDGYGQPLRLRAKLHYADQDIRVAALLAPLPRLFANEPYDVDLRVTVGDLRFETEGTIKRPLNGQGIDFGYEVSIPTALLLATKNSDKFSSISHLLARVRIKDDGGDYLFNNIEMALGESTLTATARIELDRDRPRLTLDVNADNLDMTPFGGSERSDADRQRIFSTAALPLQALSQFDFTVNANIGELKFDRATLKTLRISAQLDDGKLEINPFTAMMDGGKVAATLDLDVRPAIPQFAHTLSMEDVSMTPLVGIEAAKLVRGGHVSVSLEFKSEGASPAELAAHADGRLQLTIRDVEILNRSASLAAGDLLLNLFELLNPLARSEDHEFVECAVFNFPVHDGIAEAQTGIGISTTKLNILGGGTIDLGSENIDIGINPKPREGIGLNLAGFADFVRIGGTLSEPVPTTDAAGVATAGLKVGAAIATGGLSLLAEGLLDRSQADIDVCAVAAGTVDLAGQASSDKSAFSKAAQSTSEAVERAGNSVKGVFKSLFGD